MVAILSLFVGVASLARYRITAIMAKASITSETWRCQPCHDRVSLWSRLSSFLAVAKLSSIAQRWPSTDTSVWMPVPAGHQVVKKARSPSLILRRIKEAPGPKPRFRLIIFIGCEIGEFTVRPVMKPRALGPLASGQKLPCIGRKIAGNLLRFARNQGLACP